MKTVKNGLRHSIQRSAFLLALFGSVVVLPGCAFFLVGSAVTTTAVVATDRRTVGEQVSDKEIDLKVANEMRVNFGETANITSTSYLGVVLLTGEVFSENISKKATALATAVPQVKKVINQLYVGPLSSFGQLASDTWLASKIRSTLIATRNIPSGAIIDVVQRDNVYLMGLVTQSEADLVNRTISQISGVKEVFPFYQIMTPEQAKALAERNKINNNLPESNPSPSGLGSAYADPSPSGSPPSAGSNAATGTSATPIAPAGGAAPMPINPN
jgi:osmotically-inducible protein OsmY